METSLNRALPLTERQPRLGIPLGGVDLARDVAAFA